MKPVVLFVSALCWACFTLPVNAAHSSSASIKFIADTQNSKPQQPSNSPQTTNSDDDNTMMAPPVSNEEATNTIDSDTLDQTAANDYDADNADLD